MTKDQSLTTEPHLRASASAPKPRLYGIQILRGFAALLVVFHHEMEVAVGLVPGAQGPRFLANGAFGVDLFFPISGLVIFLTASSLRRRPPSAVPAWQDFAWRRVVRVVPLYWLGTAIKLLLFFLIPSAMLHFRLRIANVICSFLFLPTLGPDHHLLPVLPVGWTLNFEMFFYLLVALALAFRLPLLRFLAMTIGALALIGFFLPQTLGAFTYLADPIQLEFLGGLLLGALLPRIQSASGVPAWLPALVFPSALAFALLFRDIGFIMWSHNRVFLWGIPGFLMVWAVLALESRLAPASRLSLHRRRFLLLLGDASYSLYLAHTFFLPATAEMLVPLHPHGIPGLVLFIALSTTVSVAGGILVHLYVELPLLRLLSRRPIPWSTRAAQAS